MMKTNTLETLSVIQGGQFVEAVYFREHGVGRLQIQTDNAGPVIVTFSEFHSILQKAVNEKQGEES